MSKEVEQSRVKECMNFIKTMNKEFKCDTRIICMAVHYFVLFTRKVPFTEFSMFLGAAMAHYIAAKIEYRHP